MIWNDGFINSPQQGTSRALIDDHIRNTRRNTRRVMEVEHHFGPYTDRDDGSHKEGETTVSGIGEAINRDALANPQDGIIYTLVDGLDVRLQVYLDGDWHDLGIIDHGQLPDLLDHVHPQYMRTENQSLPNGDFNLGGNQLFAPNNLEDAYSGYVIGAHALHRGHRITDPFSLEPFSPEFLFALEEVDTTITQSITIGSDVLGGISGIFFCPNMRQTGGSSLVRMSAMRNNGNVLPSGHFGIILHSFANFAVRFRAHRLRVV